jgi:predicted regulator of Ras-like GTPase activity (Roadblock/LC7/MglB family)
MGDFVLYKEDLDRINKILSHLITESASAYVLLINKDGNLISQVGFSPNINTTSLAALAAGSFASTKAIATLIGEPEFSVMFHQGEKENIHISLVDEDVIMVLIFDDRTNLGLVKMIAGQAKSKLGTVLLDVRKNGVAEMMPDVNADHGSQVSDRLDSLFPDGR